MTQIRQAIAHHVKKLKEIKPGTDVLNALKGSKGLQATSPSVTTDNTKVPKNFTSKGRELTKDGASLERNNNLPPEDGNNTVQ